MKHSNTSISKLAKLVGRPRLKVTSCNIQDIPGDKANKKVTFYWQAPINSHENFDVYLLKMTDPPADIPLTPTKKLTKIPHTDIYTITQILPADLLTTYTYVVASQNAKLPEKIANIERQLNDVAINEEKFKILQPLYDFIEQHKQLDKFNTAVSFAGPSGPESILRLPNAPENLYLDLNSRHECALYNEKLAMRGRLQVITLDFNSPRYNFGVNHISYLIIDAEEDLQKTLSEWRNKNIGKEDGVIIALAENSPTQHKKIWVCNANGMEEAQGELLESLVAILNDDKFNENDHQAMLKNIILNALLPDKVKMYLPEGYTPTSGPYPLIIQLDGHDMTGMGTPAMLDKMISSGVIPPSIVVYLPPIGNRLGEYLCNNEFANYLTQELILQLRQQYNCSKNPLDTFIAGYSASGLAGLHACLTHPDIIGNAVCQSAALWDKHEEMDAAVKIFETSQQKANIVITAGKCENVANSPQHVSLLQANKNMARLLESNPNAHCDYTEYNGAHDFYCWQTTWPEQVKKAFVNRETLSLRADNDKTVAAKPSK